MHLFNIVAFSFVLFNETKAKEDLKDTLGELIFNLTSKNRLLLCPQRKYKISSDIILISRMSRTFNIVICTYNVYENIIVALE